MEQDLVDWMLEHLPYHPAGERPKLGSIFIGHPEKVPTELLQVLSAHMSRSGRFDEARLGWVMLGDGTPPHPVVGVRPAAGVDLESGCRELAEVARTATSGPVDFAALEAGTTIGDWLLQNSPPFYTAVQSRP
jgi:hypothetical protein